MTAHKDTYANEQDFLVGLHLETRELQDYGGKR